MNKILTDKKVLYYQFVERVPASVQKWLYETGQLENFKNGKVLKVVTGKDGEILDAVLMQNSCSE